MMTEDFEAIEYGSDNWIEQLKRYVNRHKAEQQPRLKELKRYYKGDNNIKYRPAKTDETAADNRISSDFAKYITIFEQGYMLGNPVEYKNENETILDNIKDFSAKNNEKKHNSSIKKDLCVYGRAYELLTVTNRDGKAWVKLYKLKPEETFVIYDDTYEQNSLMAVNYYDIYYGDSKRKTIIKVYTADHIYSYEWKSTDSDKMALKDEQEHYFKAVPVNEYSNNEDRLGSYESVLDNIDAYDLSQSELANFQQNSNDAILMIKGNPYTGAEENDFFALFTEVPTTNTKDINTHLQAMQRAWKERGITFRYKGDPTKASLISAVFHSQITPEENMLFVGHVGVLVPYEGKLLFIEKLAFQEPYQAIIFANRTELSDYLMNRYDVEWEQPNAIPFIMENDSLMDGYRPNPYKGMKSE